MPVSRLGRCALILLVLLCLFAPLPSCGADKFPSPSGPVNDFAGVIPAPYRARIDSLSREVLQKAGAAIVVATMPSIGGEDPGDYVNRLYSAWGIGKKGEDRGVLIFVAVKQRKVRIEVGYGLEGILPDGLAGEILDREAVPFLRKGEYGPALANTAAAIAGIISRDAGTTLTGNYPVQGVPYGRRSPLTGNIWFWIIVAVLVGVLATTPFGRVLLLYLFLSGLGGGRGGGGFGGFGGGGFGGFGGGSSGGGGAGRSF